MCSDLAAFSQGCALFSATGILFMSWVGVMLIKQPFFIGGIEDVEVAKGSAFGAAAMFFFTFLFSILYMIREGRRLVLEEGDRRPGSAGMGRLGGDYQQVAMSDFDPDNTQVPETFERGTLA